MKPAGATGHIPSLIPAALIGAARQSGEPWPAGHHLRRLGMGMVNRELIWTWARSRPWYKILIEIALLLAFVLSSTRLIRP